MEGTMLSQRSHYALRAVLILAANGDRSPMRTAQIARAANVSPKFLEAILLALRKSGILISHRGCKGGFQLARPATQISFADVVRVTDGSLALAPCVNEIAPAKCQDCFEEDFCEIRRALLTARDVTANALRSYDVASAVTRMRGAGTL
jgi:Rrf2 family protein